MQYWENSNAITRNNRKLKQFIKYNKETEKEIDRMRETVNKMEWTDETRIERVRIYQNLGKTIKLFRENKLKIEQLKREILSKNITG